MAIWDRYAKAYDLLSPLTSYYNELLKKVIDSLGGCKRVLDNGTGTGILAEKLAEQGKEVFGIDNSESMLCIAQNNTLPS